MLAVTGAEALYTDLGHFGRRPIRLAWFVVVLPALLLNYFGQGALLLRIPAAVENPFYLMAPRIFLYPLVAIATVATVVASQALISGAFSLTHQCVQLRYSPRVSIVHTSRSEMGQIYIPDELLTAERPGDGVVEALRARLAEARRKIDRLRWGRTGNTGARVAQRGSPEAARCTTGAEATLGARKCYPPWRG